MTGFTPIAALVLSSFAIAIAIATVADASKVVADISPVQSLVARVMAGVGTPSVIVRRGASPHDYALAPSEAQALQDADIVFWIGASLEPWLDSSLGTLAPGAQTAALLDVPGTVVLPFRTGATFAEDFGDSDPDHDYDHGTIDPHAWLDPENGKVWLDAIAIAIAIAVALSRIDPDNAATYTANAVSGQAEIDAASADIFITLAPLAGLRFVVFHDACQYFERRFDLPATGAISLGDASAPSSARIRALRD